MTYSRGGEPLDQNKHPVQPHNISGPLCFAGDIVCRSYSLPTVSSGDWLVMHDVGANTLALFSRHCSRQAPEVVGYRLRGEVDGGVLLEDLQAMEPQDRVISFWGPRRTPTR
jgi:diaminopimelate decarboxylase